MEKGILKLTSKQLSYLSKAITTERFGREEVINTSRNTLTAQEHDELNESINRLVCVVKDQPLERISEDINRSYGTKLSDEDIQNSLEKTPSLKKLARVEPLQNGEREYKGQFPSKNCECHIQEPYGFVPEADCPEHDTKQFSDFLKELLSQSKKEGRIEVINGFMHDFTNDHDKENVRWLRGIALDEKHLLQKILEFFESLTNQKKEDD